jgi:hypothetical protein
MNRRLSIQIGVLLAGIAFVASPARGDLLYATGFEQPSFTVGQLVGQGGFTIEPNVSPANASVATISTDLPRSGIQSVKIDGALFTDGFAGYDNIASYSVAANPVVAFRLDLALLGPATHDDLVSINLDFVRADGPNAGFFFADMWLSSDGTVWTFGHDGFVDTVPYQYGVYNRVMIVADFATNQAQYFLNDTLIETQSIRLGGATRFSAGFSMQAVVPTDGYVSYVDNYRLSSVPEPSTLAMTGVGVIGLLGLYLRRRRASA